MFPPFSLSLSLPSPIPLALSFSTVSLRLSLHSLSLLFLSVSISSQYLSAHLSAAGSHGKQCTARRPRKHPLLLSRRGQRAACRFRNLFPAKAPDASNHPSPPPPSSSSSSSSSSLSLVSFPRGTKHVTGGRRPVRRTAAATRPSPPTYSPACTCCSEQGSKEGRPEAFVARRNPISFLELRASNLCSGKMGAGFWSASVRRIIFEM